MVITVSNFRVLFLSAICLILGIGLLVGNGAGRPSLIASDLVVSEGSRDAAVDEPGRFDPLPPSNDNGDNIPDAGSSSATPDSSIEVNPDDLFIAPTSDPSTPSSVELNPTDLFGPPVPGSPPGTDNPSGTDNPTGVQRAVVDPENLFGPPTVNGPTVSSDDVDINPADLFGPREADPEVSDGDSISPLNPEFNPFTSPDSDSGFTRFDPDEAIAFVPAPTTTVPEVTFDFATPEYNDAANVEEPSTFAVSVEIAEAEVLPQSEVGAATVEPLIDGVEVFPTQQPPATFPAVPTTPNFPTNPFPQVPITPNNPFPTFPSNPVNPLPSNASTSIPVFDTAWQMFARASLSEADQYFNALDDWGFTGAWAAVLHHAPGTHLNNYNGGGQIGSVNSSGEIVLSSGYINRVQDILDTAQRHDQQVGLVVAWQNTYLPGGDTGSDAASNGAEGTLTTSNAAAYGRQMVQHFGNHPAVSQWVFGGDAGTNNTDANIAVWRTMATAIRDTGNNIPINYHTPTSANESGTFRHLNYANETWLDAIAPQTGHQQLASETERELRAAGAAYNVPVWAGEPRYFGINFDWVAASFRDPGVDEVRADAQAAENAGVAGYVYGDAGRWAWCAFQNGVGDASPCSASNIAASFGAGEQAVLTVFSN